MGLHESGPCLMWELGKHHMAGCAEVQARASGGHREQCDPQVRLVCEPLDDLRHRRKSLSQFTSAHALWTAAAVDAVNVAMKQTASTLRAKAIAIKAGSSCDLGQIINVLDFAVCSVARYHLQSLAAIGVAINAHIGHAPPAVVAAFQRIRQLRHHIPAEHHPIELLPHVTGICAD